MKNVDSLILYYIKHSRFKSTNFWYKFLCDFIEKNHYIHKKNLKTRLNK